MWDLTQIAASFFETHLPYWQMENVDDLVSSEGSYCFAKEGEVYAIYLHRATDATLDLKDNEGQYSVGWFNPLTGGELQSGSVKSVNAGGVCDLGTPPAIEGEPHDWVVLVKAEK
jgi:hypothetical protein